MLDRVKEEDTASAVLVFGVSLAALENGNICSRVAVGRCLCRILDGRWLVRKVSADDVVHAEAIPRPRRNGVTVSHERRILALL